jgi:hypothetical protein
MDPPPGLIPVPLKGAVLLLTAAEFTAGLRRGKCWRRQTAMQRRASTLTSRNTTSAEGGPRRSRMLVEPGGIEPPTS